MFHLKGKRSSSCNTVTAQADAILHHTPHWHQLTELWTDTHVRYSTAKVEVQVIEQLQMLNHERIPNLARWAPGLMGELSSFSPILRIRSFQPPIGFKEMWVHQYPCLPIWGKRNKKHIFQRAWIKLCFCCMFVLSCYLGADDHHRNRNINHLVGYQLSICTYDAQMYDSSPSLLQKRPPIVTIYIFKVHVNTYNLCANQHWIIWLWPRRLSILFRLLIVIVGCWNTMKVSHLLPLLSIFTLCQSFLCQEAEVEAEPESYPEEGPGPEAEGGVNRTTCRCKILQTRIFAEINDKSGCADVAKAIYTALGVVSVFATLLTIIVYSILPGMRNLHGKILMSCAFSTLLATLYLIIVYNYDSSCTIGCTVLGYFGLFSNLSMFSWMTIMCLNMVWTFKSMRAVDDIGSRFFIFSALGWGFPFLFSATTLIFQVQTSIPNNNQVSIPVDHIQRVQFQSRDRNWVVLRWRPCCLSPTYLLPPSHLPPSSRQSCRLHLLHRSHLEEQCRK